MVRVRVLIEKVYAKIVKKLGLVERLGAGISSPMMFFNCPKLSIYATITTS